MSQQNNVRTDQRQSTPVTAPADTQALARRQDAQITAIVEGEVVTEIRTREDYAHIRAALEAKGVHVLSPAVDIAALPPMWALVPSVVLVDPDPEHGDVYQDRLFCKNDEVALAKPALRRILQAGGFSVDPIRTDPRDIPNYWEFKTTLRFTGVVGQPVTLSAHGDFDLRDGSPRVKIMEKAARRRQEEAKAARQQWQHITAENQLDNARMFGMRNAESRATNAAARELGLKQKYKRRELEKPFVQFVPVFRGDPDNPEIQRMIAANALGNAQLLGVGGGAPAPLDLSGHPGEIGVNKLTGEVTSEKAYDPGEGVEFGEEPAAAEDKDEPITGEAFTVASVRQVADKDFRIFTHQMPTTPFLTDDPDTARQAQALKKSGKKFRVELDRGTIVRMQIVEDKL